MQSHTHMKRAYFLCQIDFLSLPYSILYLPLLIKQCDAFKYLIKKDGPLKECIFNSKCFIISKKNSFKQHHVNFNGKYKNTLL